MHAPLASLLYGFVASSPYHDAATSSALHATTTYSFWHDAAAIAELDDPPPTDILKHIQAQPWRGGLEPVNARKGIPLHDCKIVEGKIPDDLHGMLCRNGPGRIRVGASQYGHWFDGDGLVMQLNLDGSSNSASFQAKYVQTERFRAQQKVVEEMKAAGD